MRSNNTALASITLRQHSPASADLDPHLTKRADVVHRRPHGHIGWSVTNIGNVSHLRDQTGGSDQVYLLADANADVVLRRWWCATSRNRNRGRGRKPTRPPSNFTVPATLLGPMYVIVKVDRFGFLSEVGHTANNVVAAATPTQVVGNGFAQPHRRQRRHAGRSGASATPSTSATASNNTGSGAIRCGAIRTESASSIRPA
jgi:hypothetical protein